MLEREKWDLRRQTKEATEQANILRSQMDMKENRIKELEAELTMVSHPAEGQKSQCLEHRRVTCVIIWLEWQTRRELAVYSHRFKQT